MARKASKFMIGLFVTIGASIGLIEVVMKIDLRGELEREYVAQLKAAGITGIVFIELNRKEPGEPNLSPPITFASEYPMVASKPSDMSQIVSSVQVILEDLKKI